MNLMMISNGVFHGPLRNGDDHTKLPTFLQDYYKKNAKLSEDVYGKVLISNG